MSYSPESIRNTSVSDQATNTDTLGFQPYVTAIAEFLHNKQTQPPLTLSIEGESDSGGLSFMKQLEQYLKSKGERTVWFDAWRYNNKEAEEVLAAFASSFINQISTPQNSTWQSHYNLFLGHFKLAISRFDFKKGWLELLLAGAITIFVLCVALAIPFILLLYGMEGIKLLNQALKSKDRILQALLYLLGIVAGGSLSWAGLIVLLKNLWNVIGSSKLNLIKYLEAPDYKKEIGFVDKFHNDFTKIVKAYVDQGRVYVFIDDLDHPGELLKSADLFQAISRIIADNLPLVFILGMDREKVAASFAVKYENILPYLISETAEIDPDILERRTVNKGLAYGYAFIEKFVQLPFFVPQPSQENFERFLAQLATSRTQTTEISSQKPKFSWRKLLPRNLFSRSKVQSDSLATIPNQDSLSDDIQNDIQNDIQAEQQAAIKRLEAIQVQFEQDSPTVRDVIMMVAPALDYNPRRIKQFINVFRLKVYIAFTTGLFFEERDSEGNLLHPCLTFEQLGKFTAISLKWPLLLSELDTDSRLLAKLEDFALRESIPPKEGETKEYGDAVRYWGSHSKLKALIAYGLEKSATEEVPQMNPKFSLAAVKVEKLLHASVSSGDSTT